MLVLDSAPIITLITAHVLESVHIGLMIAVILKNPGWVSKQKEGEFYFDKREGHRNVQASCAECKVLSKVSKHC